MNEPGSIGWHDLTVDDADGVREHGASRFCIIRDPAGAVAALYQA